MDRFAIELVMMEGIMCDDGPAGFAVATQNDAPIAAKAHVLAKAFLGLEMQCARCHDAPYHPYKQEELFGLAAMLFFFSSRRRHTSCLSVWSSDVCSSD